MSGVALRCPNCGTTAAGPGECDACHEAGVRYYCSNHAPGRWLESPACPACGARFGEAPRPPAPAVRPSATRPSPAPTRASTGAPAAARAPRAAPAAPAAPSMPVRWPPAATEPSPGGWVERARGEAPPPSVDADLAPAGRAVGGCLLRLAMLALFALLALVVGVFMLGGSLLRLFGLY